MLPRTCCLVSRVGVASLALMALATFSAVRAQDADPPGRVARLSAAEGSVSLQPAGVQEWTGATLNRPLTTGDRLWSDQNSRAELDMGSAVVRLGPSTGFSFFNLDDRTVQMQLTAGTLIVRVRDLQSEQVYEIDTPNLAVTLLQPGVYRVEVDEAGDGTVLKVSEGSAEAEGGGQSFTIGMQQMASFSGVGALTYASATLGVPDDLDEWSASRERTVEASASRGYVPEDIPGTQDLDANGAWQATAEYGYVWAPFAVVAGWTPYRFGHWVWIAPWGWTWVDDAPWGYAPFHYGRWVIWNSAWCWVPGPRLVRPVYAPALVAWVRAPDRRRAGGIGPNVAWFPLGPRESFEPAYRVSPDYSHRINRGTVTGLPATGRYVNNTAGGVTAVSEAVFTTGQRVGVHAVRVSNEALVGATVAAAPPAIAPVHASVLGSAPPRALRPPPVTLMNRPVLARTPPPHAPVPFDKQLAAIQANGGHPVPRTELAKLAPPAAAAPVRMLPGPARPLPRPIAPPVGVAAPAGGFSERTPQHTPLPGGPRENSFGRPPQVPQVAPESRVPQPGIGAAPNRSDRSPRPSAPVPAAPPAPSVGVPRVPAPSAPPPNSYRAPPAVAAPPVARPQAAAPARPPPPPPPARDSGAHADKGDRGTH